MLDTKPLFVIKKYRSILLAAAIVEAVSYIVSLTDSIVAGNMINSSAFAAIGLISPFISVSVFISSIINSGTIKYYSDYIGAFENRRAKEIFSQGVYMSILAGFAYAAIMFVLRDSIISILTDSAVMQQYAREYYNIILLMIVIHPVSFLIDNMTIADGGEKLSAVANMIFIISNIVLSVVFARLWGIKGIAAASAVSRYLFVLIIFSRFLGKKNTLKLTWHWRRDDAVKIFNGGIVKASNYALEAVNVFAINLFAVHYFDEETLVLLVMIERFLGVLTLFIGLAMAAQPLIGTLNGERNHKALRYLMKKVCSDMAVTGVILTVFTLMTTPYLVNAFGIYGDPLHGEGVMALRIVSATLVIHSLLVLFFIYYYLMGKQLLAFWLCLIKNLISPLTLAVLFSILTESRTGMWIGLAIAPFTSFIVCSQAIYIKYVKNKQEGFPFLLPVDGDEKTFIYSFDISVENTAALTENVNDILGSLSVPDKTKTMAVLFLEELLLLIMDKNEGKKTNAECTVMVEPDGIRLVMRYSGIRFDITDVDADVVSFRQYIISNMMYSQKSKAYLLTTGYNRTELFFSFNILG